MLFEGVEGVVGREHRGTGIGWPCALMVLKVLWERVQDIQAFDPVPCAAGVQHVMYG